MGRALHTIIGQGSLDEVLGARPEERRQFIEDAAGEVAPQVEVFAIGQRLPQYQQRACSRATLLWAAADSPDIRPQLPIEAGRPNPRTATRDRGADRPIR